MAHLQLANLWPSPSPPKVFTALPGCLEEAALADRAA